MKNNLTLQIIRHWKSEYIKWVETMILLLKHLSPEQWLSPCVSQRDLRRGCRMQGEGRQSDSHLPSSSALQLCFTVLVRIRFHLRKGVPHHKQNKDHICLSICNVKKPQLRLHHFLLGLLYSSSHWCPCLIFTLCYPPSTLLPN